MFCPITAAPMSIVLFLHLVFAGWIGGENLPPDNRFVKVDVSLADTLLQAGSKGKILVSFAPVDGIHVNVDPPVTVMVEKNRFIALHGEPDITADKETGFLSTVTPVVQGFSISRKAAPGPHHIKGTITYYFCSDTEGWCRKQSRTVMLTLNIQRQ